MKLTYRIQIICTDYPDGVNGKFANIYESADSDDMLIDRFIRPQLAALRNAVIAEKNKVPI